MCYRPIRILNKSRSFDKKHSPLFFDVPCGKCEQCLASSTNDWFLRAFYQWRTYETIGGNTFFITLTYRDADLPLHGKYKVFNKRHIQSFIKKLKIYLARAGLPDNIGYFITCEYGSKFDRPHYHGLLYLPFQIDSFRLHNFFNDGFIDRAWKYGFNAFSKKFGAKVVSPAALRYVVKYLFKFNEIYSQDGLFEYLDTVEDSHIYKPFHLQNKGFGLSMKDVVNDNNIINNYIPYIEDSRTVFNYPIPTYIKRKLLYDYDKENFLYRLNSYGVDVKYKQALQHIMQISDKFSAFFADVNNFCFGCTDDILIYLRADSPETLKHEIDEKFNGNFENLAYYYFYFRFMSCDTALPTTENIKKLFELRYKQYLQTNKIYDESPLDWTLFNKLKAFNYDKFPTFSYYFFLCKLYDDCLFVKNQLVNNTKLLQRIEKQNTKKLFTHE